MSVDKSAFFMGKDAYLDTNALPKREGVHFCSGGCIGFFPFKLTMDRYVSAGPIACQFEFICGIPYDNFESRWPPSWWMRYSEITKKLTSFILPGTSIIEDARWYGINSWLIIVPGFWLFTMELLVEQKIL